MCGGGGGGKGAYVERERERARGGSLCAQHTASDVQAADNGLPCDAIKEKDAISPAHLINMYLAFGKLIRSRIFIRPSVVGEALSE